MLRRLCCVVLGVNAATPPGPTLQSVTLNPASVTGGSASTRTVAFSAVTDGAVKPKAILSVYSRSGSLMFTLTNNGGGRYSAPRP